MKSDWETQGWLPLVTQDCELFYSSSMDFPFCVSLPCHKPVLTAAWNRSHAEVQQPSLQQWTKGAWACVSPIPKRTTGVHQDLLLTAAPLQPLTAAQDNPRHLESLEAHTAWGRAPKGKNKREEKITCLILGWKGFFFRISFISQSN